MNETLTVVNQPNSLISVSKENSTSASIAELGAAHIDANDSIGTIWFLQKTLVKTLPR